MRRTVVAPFVALLLLSAWCTASTPAAAAPPTRQGWWRAGLVVGGVDLSALLGIDLTALLAPSTIDVPADGLLVAGGTSLDAPQALAAVAYDLGGGAIGGPLKLAPHPLGATVPGSGAMACPLDRPVFEPAQGGKAEQAPTYDCLGAVPATVDAAGVYTFDVTTLQREGVVAVAILPTTPTSRIVFASPTGDSLPVAAAVPSAVAPSPPPALATEGFVTIPAPIADPAVGLPSAAPEASPVTRPSVTAPALPIESSSSDGSVARAYALLALAALAGGGWLFGGRQRQSAPVSSPSPVGGRSVPLRSRLVRAVAKRR